MARSDGPGGPDRRMRDASAPVRLLLFAVLLIGTIGMHTIGHPPEARAASATSPAMTSAMASVTASEPPATMPADTCPEGHCSPAAHGAPPALGTGAGHGTGHGTPSDHGRGMDLASLCTAIALAAFVLVVALLAVRLGRQRQTLGTRGLWGRLSSVRPPPRPPDLSRLAVLRI